MATPPEVPPKVPPGALALGRVASLHPQPRGIVVATDLPLRLLRWPVGTGTRLAFHRPDADASDAPAGASPEAPLEATVRAIGTPGPGPREPVLVFLVDAAVGARLRVGDAVRLCP